MDADQLDLDALGQFPFGSDDIEEPVELAIPSFDGVVSVDLGQRVRPTVARRSDEHERFGQAEGCFGFRQAEAESGGDEMGKMTGVLADGVDERISEGKDRSNDIDGVGLKGGRGTLWRSRGVVWGGFGLMHG